MESVFQRTPSSGPKLRSNIRRIRPASPPVAETPAVVRPLVPAPSAPSDDLSTPWKFHGGWSNGPEHAPVRASAGDPGVTLLSLHLRASPAVRADITKIHDQQAADTKAAALSTFQAEECWQTYIKARADFKAAQEKISGIKAQIAALEEERNRLQSLPKGAGKRLLAIENDRVNLAAEHEETEAELAALQVLVQSAELEAREQASETAKTVAAKANQQRRVALDCALAEFAEQHRDELTKLLALVSPPPQGTSYTANVNTLTGFLVAALQQEPLPQNTEAITEQAPV